jgi:septal ring factor EnvC (AmiA/AmiB activator)
VKNTETLTKKLEALQKTMTESQEENSKLLAECRDLRTKVKKQTLEIETLTAEREGYEGRINVIKNRMTKLEKEGDQLKSEKLS